MFVEAGGFSLQAMAPELVSLGMGRFHCNLESKAALQRALCHLSSVSALREWLAGSRGRGARRGPRCAAAASGSAAQGAAPRRAGAHGAAPRRTGGARSSAAQGRTGSARSSAAQGRRGANCLRRTRLPG